MKIKRFGIYMKDEMHRVLKVLSAKKGISMNAFIIEAINEKLKKEGK